MNERPFANQSGDMQGAPGGAETPRTVPIDFDAYLEDFRRHVLAPYGRGRGCCVCHAFRCGDFCACRAAAGGSRGCAIW